MNSKAKKTLLGLGVIFVLLIASLIYFQNHSEKNVTKPKVVKTVAVPKPAVKPKPEEQPKKEEPVVIETKFPEINHGPGSKSKGPSNLKYVINASYDSKKHVIQSTMSVDFTNNLDVDLNDLYFNVWGNADVFLARTKKDLNLKIEQVQVNGNPVNFSQQSTVLHIPQVTIKKLENAKVEMKFSLTLPEGEDRFGWNKTTTSLGNWFPILAVYDNEGWNVDPYYKNGESFYSLSSDFDVTFTTEKNQVIATTGIEAGKPKVKSGLATHKYKAENVRDFAMEMDSRYKIKHGKEGGVNVNVYYTPEQQEFVDEMLYAGTSSIKQFSETFGQYPWPELDICGMQAWFGGMEYPQLVMINITPGKPMSILSTTAHEVGHQWFYGIIGNNEYDEPWLDESLTTFAQSMYDGALDRIRPMEKSMIGDVHLSSPIATYTENEKKGIENNYNLIVYIYGNETINDLRRELGDDQFYASMKAYFNEMKFGVSTTADFIRIMEQTSKRDLSKFFKDHLVFVEDQK